MSYATVLQFMLAKGVGDATLKKISAFLQIHPQYNWKDAVSLSFLKEITLSLNLKQEIIDSIINAKKIASLMTNELIQQDIKIIIETDPEYPQQLKKTLGNYCPFALFAKGNTDILKTQNIGFCGSRKASDKGLKITYNCAKQLAHENITVTSGYAAGVDMVSHQAALENNGKTIFVLAEGILKFTLKLKIKNLINPNNHVFISQFLPGLTWQAVNAMKRNKVIIGLSDAMILVESGLSGGTFEAGESTLNAKHPLFVIDFAKPEVSAAANPYFIKRGGIAIKNKAEASLTKNLEPNMGTVFEIINKPKDIALSSNKNVSQLKLAL